MSGDRINGTSGYGGGQKGFSGIYPCEVLFRLGNANILPGEEQTYFTEKNTGSGSGL